MGISFLQVCSGSTELPHFAVFLGNWSFFNINLICTIDVLLLLFDCFKISVVRIHYIPCGLGIPFVDFSYRKAYEADSRIFFFNIAHLFICEDPQVYIYIVSNCAILVQIINCRVVNHAPFSTELYQSLSLYYYKSLLLTLPVILFSLFFNF